MRRLLSIVGATFVALACGTNVCISMSLIRMTADWLTFVQYVYSAWAPQFAERLKLSSTESNLIVFIARLNKP